MAGDWLRIWIVASVTISAIGLFLAEMSSDIYQLDGMADMGMIPQVFRVKNRFGVPVVALLLQASIIMVIVQCIDTLEDIIALEMISYCFAQLLEFSAFARLRWTHPNAKRPYKVVVAGNVFWMGTRSFVLVSLWHEPCVLTRV